MSSGSLGARGRGSLKWTGYIEETRYIPTVTSRPARSTLRSLCHSTRLSSAQRIGHENFGLLLYLTLALALVYIFTFGLASFSLSVLDIMDPALRSNIARVFTGLALIGFVAMVERYRPGFLKRLLWQVTIPLLGLPRRRKRTWLRQSLKVPVDIEVNLDGERPNIRWRARREDGTVVRVVQLSHLPHRGTPPPGVSRDGLIDLLEDGLTLELTRDPCADGRAHLRLRAPGSHDGLDIALEMSEAQSSQLAPMSRSGVWLEDHHQRRLVAEVVQIALLVGATVPVSLRGHAEKALVVAPAVVAAPSA